MTRKVVLCKYCLNCNISKTWPSTSSDTYGVMHFTNVSLKSEMIVTLVYVKKRSWSTFRTAVSQKLMLRLGYVRFFQKMATCFFTLFKNLKGCLKCNISEDISLKLLTISWSWLVLLFEHFDILYCNTSKTEK